ncbi:hydroxymethylglutaryl-CoA reductase, degradative [Schleiferiaceae bacterium]|nr:hydroxymethylglutaryl-CoA reductase, degradative [Schleiferiaceae bacterium]|tara:strand:+ start:870 stop:2201 length:1332 start_codon:yes stop_codon:yes gene_type:complete
MMEPIKGFSKLSKEAKLQWLTTNNFEDSEEAQKVFRTYWHEDGDLQKKHDEFIENTMTNYFMPYGVAPNFEINGKLHTIPMAIEESSVVAAASKSASYWKERGGFKVEVISTEKIGHVHFMYEGDATPLFDNIHLLEEQLRAVTAELTANMESRGGGITSITLVDKRPQLAHYFQLEVCFETCDSMGANFINSNLEVMASSLEQFAKDHVQLEANKLEVVMRILSNYTPHCVVKASVSCPIAQLESEGISAAEFARKFKRAIDIANVEPYRATTHNKGIMNGIDAVVIATGNDFRAVEAACHTYASRSGKYKSLTHCTIDNDVFTFWIEIPLALGVVGGLTKLHPLVVKSLEMLGKPDARELMGIVAVSGLAQNFAALRALVTTGIQKGHMKMHLMNILTQLEATLEEKQEIAAFFKDKVPHHREVVNHFCAVRGVPIPTVKK